MAGQLLLESRAVRLALKSRAKARELQAWRACVGAGAAPVLTTARPEAKSGVEIKPLARALLLPWNTWNCSKTPGPTEADLAAQVLCAFLPGGRGILAGKLCVESRLKQSLYCSHDASRSAKTLAASPALEFPLLGVIHLLTRASAH